MSVKVDSIDLTSFGLVSGEGKSGRFVVPIEPLLFGGQKYTVELQPPEVVLEISRMVGNGYALKLKFEAAVGGPCMRCLDEGETIVDVESFEVHQSADDPDLSSPYVADGVLDLRAWARDALVLVLNGLVLCKPDCRGLCGECGINLNEVEGEHVHERPKDPRFSALDNLKLE